MSDYSKHAYLIYAHSNILLLSFLLKSIDDYRNDIYLHVDKKWKEFDSKALDNVVKKSKFMIFRKFKVYWGHGSQIKAELFLFKKAYINPTPYKYYHLLSGSDMCIKSQDYIHNFFEGRNDIFLDYTNDINWIKNLNNRIGYFRFNNPKIDNVFLRVQKKLRIRRKTLRSKLYGGANWCSLPDYCVKFLLIKTKCMKLSRYLHGRFADEIYKQDIIAKSPLYTNVSNLGNLRHIDWNRGHPYVFDSADYAELKDSQCLFARKFDTHDLSFLERILSLSR